MNKKYITFELGNYLENAGLLGLFKMLTFDKKRNNLDYKFIEFESGIKVEKDYFMNLDITKLYFDTLIDEYGKYCSIGRVFEIIDILINILENEEHDEKIVKNMIKDIKSKLSSNSIKTGYEIVKSQIDYQYDLYDELNNLDDLSNLKIKLNKLKEFLNVDKVKETFYMKSIAYTIINNFWENKSFLNKSNSKDDMYNIHKREIEIPLKEFILNNKKENFYCVECGAGIENKYKMKFTFIKDTSEDIDRKKSMFWNFKVNDFVCPKCLFIYTLIPLGFMKNGNDYILINNNSSFINLISNNKKPLEENDKNIYNYLLFNLLDKKTSELHNVQVITRSNDKKRYVFNIIDKKTLQIFDENKTNLEKLSYLSSIKIGNDYYNVFEQVIENILQKLSLYSIIDYLLALSLKKEYDYLKTYIYYLISIQIKMNEKKERDGGLVMEKTSKYYFVAKEAKKLRNELIKDSKEDDSKIIGITYKLSNVLHQNNVHEFINIIIRLYNSVNLQIPQIFIETLKDDLSFANVGYAFILGFRGSFYEKDEKEGEKNE